MADSRLPALTEISAPVLLDEYYTVDVSDTTDHASGTSRKITGTRLGGLLAPVVGGRLTTESGVAVSSSDRTSQGTLYFTPWLHNLIRIYDGTRWQLYTFTERSLSLSMTSGVNYDIFIYDNSGTLTLEATAWTNDTTRATALTTQDGVLVRSGATTRLYLGTIRASGTNVTEDSDAKRFVWNFYNRVPRRLQVLDSTDSWTYTTSTVRQARGSTSNQVEIINGLVGSSVSVGMSCLSTQTNASIDRSAGIGVNSTTAMSGMIGYINVNVATTSAIQINCNNRYIAREGYSYFAWLEWSGAAGTTTWYGDGGVPTIIQSGISGEWQC